MRQASPIPSVALVGGIPRVSSLDIAERFGKPHKDVLNVIRRIIADLAPDFHERNFSPMSVDVKIGNGAVRKSPAYNLTRDAFSLVVMGFTGKEALAWKVRYIEAFNAMEAALAEKARRKAIAARRKPAPFLDRLGLSPYEKVLMGPQVRAMLDSEGEVGPHTLECILLKARYVQVIDEVYRLSQSLAADLRRTSLAGQIMQTVNKSRDFSDPFIETLTADEYLISQMGRDFHSTAFRALNNNICMAKMLGR